MICISVVQSWNVSYFKAVKEFLQPSYFRQIFRHFIIVAVVFLLHLLSYQLRISSNKESSNAQIFSQSKSSDQPLILCNIIGSRKPKLNYIFQNVTFGWYKYNTSPCSFQGVGSVKIYLPNDRVTHQCLANLSQPIL
jgi:hypothetical protein